MATGVTAEAIQLMIQEALAAQAEVHRKELATQAARFQTSSAVPTPPASPTNSSTRSTVKGTRLNMGPPSLVFNGLGGTSTSEMATAAVARASALAAASSSSNPSQQDFFYDSFVARDQTKLELSLIERNDDPGVVTDSGLLASLKCLLPAATVLLYTIMPTVA